MRKQPFFFTAALFSLLLISSAALGATYVVEPLLVAQPAYAGMNFHVYRPYNMPEGWFVTFDGYPVHKSPSGVWVYGTYDGVSLTPTNYVVGSVHPQSLSIVQYAPSAQVSSLREVPVTPILPVLQPAPQPAPIAQIPAQSATVPPTYVPQWAVQASFTSIAAWNKLVDRMGILEKPRTPIAWKGDRPEALYVWTGKSWYQILSRSDTREKPSEMIKGHLYALTRMINTNNFHWKDIDTALLANQAALWGYLWMGRIAPSNF